MASVVRVRPAVIGMFVFVMSHMLGVGLMFGHVMGMIFH
jgi:hypothetical protein